MSRKKLAHSEDRLSHNIIIRVPEKLFKKLEQLRKESRSASIAEVCRKILTNQKIRLYRQDVSMDPVMEELALIRRDLKAIGININQVTRKFNGAQAENQRSYYALQTADLYQKVGTKVDELLRVVSKLADKWLQE
ncbi:MAG TPA: plasmid mobilization relaxosome protein MobC [Mucilaginibacter sp.]|nr:plasmid mobilization relaxosome protein MobC [Mucilaginibacter sp.]